MTEEQLSEGQELLALISTTRDALRAVTKLHIQDNHYFLAISRHKDGGDATALYRKRGNQELLAVIQAELESQLSKYEAEFAAL